MNMRKHALIAFCAASVLAVGSVGLAHAVIVPQQGGGGGSSSSSSGSTHPGSTDTISTLYATGTFVGAPYANNPPIFGALSGSLTIDSTVGSVQSFDLNVGTLTFSSASSYSYGTASVGGYLLQQTISPSDTLELGFFPSSGTNTNPLVGFTSGTLALTSLSDPLTNSNAEYASALVIAATASTLDPTYFLSSGELSSTKPPSSSVPEPGSLVLFAVGLLGILGLAVRRRRQRRS